MQVWDRGGTHTAELLREFALVTIGSTAGTTRQLPDELLEFVGDLRARYAGTSITQAAELEQAVKAGESAHDFTYEVPDGIGAACQTLLELLDAADDYCRQGDRLITLVSPPDQQAFRTCSLGEFVRQSAGLPARPWDGPTA